MKQAYNIFQPASEKIKKYIWMLGRHAFELVLFLIFVSLIVGAVIFYKYAYLAEVQQSKAAQRVLKFNASVFQNVVDRMAQPVSQAETPNLEE